MMFPFSYTIIWSLVFGAVSAYIAYLKGKSPFIWFILGTLFGVFGILFLFLSPKPKAKKQNPKTEDKTTTIDITPTVSSADKEKFWYYLDPSNEQYGPMSFDALVREWKNSKISEKTYVWNENLDNWKPFSEFLKS